MAITKILINGEKNMDAELEGKNNAGEGATITF